MPGDAASGGRPRLEARLLAGRAALAGLGAPPARLLAAPTQDPSGSPLEPPGGAVEEFGAEVTSGVRSLLASPRRSPAILAAGAARRGALAGLERRAAAAGLGG